MTRKRFWGAVSRALFDTDLTGIRCALAFSELLWAVLLIWPGPTFDRPTYHAMAHVMLEEAWALLFFASAVTQIMVVVQEDFHSTFARYFAAYNSVLWIFVVVSMMISVYPPPAAISAKITMAIFAAWIWVRPYILAEGYRRARATT